MDLSFLSNLTITAPEAKARTVRSGIPLEGSIRIRKTGKIEFSEEFRKQVNGNWIDLFFAHKWLQYDMTKPNVMFVNITTENNRAKADVKVEGISSFIKELFWAEAASTLGFDPELSFVDLQVVNMDVFVPIALLPKTVQRGDEKGNVTYVQREKATLYPVVLCDMFTSANATDENIDVVMEDDDQVTDTQELPFDDEDEDAEVTIN